MPEFLECNTNYKYCMIDAFEFNSPDDPFSRHNNGGEHRIELVLRSKVDFPSSYEKLYTFTKNSDYSVKQYMNANWGYKAREGQKYTNLGEKFIKLLKQYERKIKIEEINESI